MNSKVTQKHQERGNHRLDDSQTIANEAVRKFSRIMQKFNGSVGERVLDETDIEMLERSGKVLQVEVDSSSDVKMFRDTTKKGTFFFKVGSGFYKDCTFEEGKGYNIELYINSNSTLLMSFFMQEGYIATGLVNNEYEFIR